MVTRELILEKLNTLLEYGPILKSTSFEVVSFRGDLYNVDGSSDDPELGASWKQLLIDEVPSINASTPCYVTNVRPTGNSTHPQFRVGGHMTTDPEGYVELGGECYLMPLCSWHNSKSRDGKRFKHTRSKMMKLHGYMKGELKETFLLRSPISEDYSLLYETNEGWTAKKNFSKNTLGSMKKDILKESSFILLEKSTNDKLYVCEHNLK